MLTIFGVIFSAVLVAIFFGTFLLCMNLLNKTFGRFFNKEVFVVTAHRHGEKNSHNYVVGTFSTKLLATVAADTEDIERKDEYVCKITPVILNKKKNTFSKMIRF